MWQDGDMKSPLETHADRLRNQYSRQAVPFARLGGHHDAMDLLLKLSEVSGCDNVLDVGCGPGMVACAFARRAHRVTGIDFTPRMLEEARKRNEEAGLSNLRWDCGSAESLPYPDASFSIVLTRYTFHHLLDPSVALREMCRVCRPGGRVLVADPVLPSTKVDAFNAMEKIRDPSHVRAFSEEAFEALMVNSGLAELQRATYAVEMELETQLAASFPEPGGAGQLRDLFAEDIGRDRLGVGARRVDESIHFQYPISVYTGIRPYK